MRRMLIVSSLVMLLLTVVFPAAPIAAQEGHESTPEASPQASPTAGLPPIVAITFPETDIPSNGLTLGDPAAPVSVTVYGDYQCPFCATASAEWFRPLLEEYIVTGAVVLTYVPMAFLGDESRAAVEAALCANDQGKFWEMHETIYANHHGENQGALSRSRLSTMAENVGLNMNRFRSCLDSGEHRADVANYTDQAIAAGITSVPSFVIDDGAPMGWASWDGLKRQIDAALDQ